MGLVNFREELFEANMMGRSWVTPLVAEIQSPHQRRLIERLSKVEEDVQSTLKAINLQKRTTLYRLRNIERYAFEAERKQKRIAKLENDLRIGRKATRKSGYSRSARLSRKIKNAEKRVCTLNTILKAYRSSREERISIIKALALEDRRLQTQVRVLQETMDKHS